MRRCQIQCNFGVIDDLCKLGKDCLTALTCNFHSRQNSKTSDILHALISIISRCKDSQKQSGFLAHPVQCHTFHIKLS